VTPKSIIHVKGDQTSRKKAKWEAGQSKILRACSNTRQLAISLEGGQIVYFELDEMSGMLNEVESRFFPESEITCLDIGEVPEGR
jgi:splicing factor 3B subunit 3